jgi:hypothetical protein
LDEEEQLELVLEEVLKQREHKLRSKVIRECLVRWRGLLGREDCDVSFPRVGQQGVT